MEMKYSISDAAKQLSVETHVLRYWEVELGLHIRRNSQGHRFYDAKDISILKNIKDLKEQGFQLKAIKMILPDIDKIHAMEPQKLYRLREELNQQVQAAEMYHPAMQRTAQVTPLHPNYTSASPAVERVSQEEKLRHFEAMMRKMIQTTVKEMERESEERICEKITTKLIKEMDYLTRQREELHERQIALLNKILSEVKKELPEAAAAEETEVKPLQSRKKKKEKKEKKQKKKLFAKSNG